MLRKLLAVLCFSPLAALATVTPLPGSTPQRGPVTDYFQPIRVQVTDMVGAPQPGVYVYWYLPYLSVGMQDMSMCFFDAGYTCRMTTDAQGVAQLPPMKVYPPGVYHITVYAPGGYPPGQPDLGSAAIELIADPVDVPPIGSVQDMWWSGPSQTGWGMSIAQHGESLFSVIYAYDSAGNPTWWVLPDGQWDAGYGSVFRGAIYAPTSAPFSSYDASRFQPGSAVGDLAISFPGMTPGINAHIGASTVMKPIMRQDFSSSAPSPVSGVGDMWWGGPEQNGWGVAIMEQPGGLFAVWLTYGDDGKPTWFVMPAGTWTDARTYSGAMYKTHGSNWTYMYDASKLSIVDTGTFTLRFADDQHATLDYSIVGHSGTLALQRQSF